MIERGQTPPQWYLDEPHIYPGDRAFLRAYFELTTCRQYVQAAHGSVAGPIPWLAIHQYAQAKHLDDEAADVLHYVVVALEKANAEWDAKRASERRRMIASSDPKAADDAPNRRD